MTQIPGPTGELEVVVETPPTLSQQILGICCHPHPQHGGTMQNKVVTTMSRVFERLGLISVRFNFRGVGKSEGSYDNGVGEQEDLRAVIDWLQARYPDYQLVLAGFSFGAYIAAKVAATLQPLALVTIAPPVRYEGFASLPPITFPWIVVQGDQDEVASPEAVFAWVDNLSPQPDLVILKGAGHFFHGQLIKLRDSLITALQPIITDRL